MKIINTREEFDVIRAVADSILIEEAELPSQIFKKQYDYLLFVDADILAAHILWEIQKNFLPAIGEDHYLVTTIDPDPVDYYEKQFGNFYCTFEFSVLDSERSFLEAINDFPKDSRADSLSVREESLLVFSPTADWAFYGERDSVGVCGFSTKVQRDAFIKANPNYLLPGGVKEAADFAYGETSWRKGSPDLEKQFIENYGPKLIKS